MLFCIHGENTHVNIFVNELFTKGSNKMAHQ